VVRKVMADMAILRLGPGEEAPRTGCYALVHEWGEATGVSLWREKGERLPLITVSGEGPLWFVLVGTPSENVEAA
jgi:hypothetical protein